MSDAMLYNHKGQILRMGRDALFRALADSEMKLRTGKFAYTEQQIFEPQIKEIRETWPDEFREKMRQTAKEMTPQGQPVAPSTIRQAMILTFENMICPKRAVSSQTKPLFEFREASGDIAMSTLIRKAPSAQPSSLQSVRKYGDKMFRIKISAAPQRLVVNCDELEKSDGTERPGVADIYVMAYFNADLKSAFMLGWASKEDIRSAKKGNRNIDKSCAWDKMAFYINMEQLRPMGALVASLGIQEVPSGILFETPPNRQELPILVRQDLQDMGKGQSPDEFDFLAACGITPAKKQEPAAETAPPAKKSAPVAEKDIDL